MLKRIINDYQFSFSPPQFVWRYFDYSIVNASISFNNNCQFMMLDQLTAQTI